MQHSHLFRFVSLPIFKEFYLLIRPRAFTSVNKLAKQPKA